LPQQIEIRQHRQIIQWLLSETTVLTPCSYYRGPDARHGAS
jgi:hypothetical protein